MRASSTFLSGLSSFPIVFVPPPPTSTPREIRDVCNWCYDRGRVRSPLSFRKDEFRTRRPTATHTREIEFLFITPII